MNDVLGMVLVAAIGAAATAGGHWLNSRGKKQEARNTEAATIFDGFEKLSNKLSAELDDQAERHRRELEDQRHRFTQEVAGWHERLERAAAELEACEARCEECRHGMAELLATLSALRAVVVDEVAKAAADRAFDTHAAGIDPADLEAADAASIRRLLENLQPSPPKEPT